MMAKEFLTGVRRMSVKFKALRKNFPKESANALFQEGQIEMTEMKRRTPVRNDILRSSGIVQDPEITRRRISVLLTFGGEASAYALQVHEDLEAFHKTGQAKFVESVLNESSSSMRDRVAKRIDFNKMI